MYSSLKKWKLVNKDYVYFLFSSIGVKFFSYVSKSFYSLNIKTLILNVNTILNRFYNIGKCKCI